MSWLHKFFKFREHSDGDVVKPFLDHMEDLRWVLIKIALTVLVGMGVAFIWVERLMDLVRAPLEEIDPNLPKELVTHGIAEPFSITLHLAFFGGIVLALPFLIYFLAGFILPALTRQEKKWLFPGIFGSFMLFLGGVLTSYYYILPKTLLFFHHYAEKIGVRTMWTWKDYLSFCTWLTVGFGLLCQLPVIVVLLSMIGLINYHFLARTRSYAITVILIFSAIIAPTPDPMTFLTLGTPVIALYEACIWIVWLLERRKRKRERAEADKAAFDEYGPH